MVHQSPGSASSSASAGDDGRVEIRPRAVVGERHVLRRRRDDDRCRGVFALELAELPLPRDEPDRVGDARAQTFVGVGASRFEDEIERVCSWGPPLEEVARREALTKAVDVGMRQASARPVCRGARACASSRVSSTTSSRPALSRRCERSGGTATQHGLRRARLRRVESERRGRRVTPARHRIGPAVERRDRHGRAWPRRRRVRTRRRPGPTDATDRRVRPAPPPRRATCACVAIELLRLERREPGRTAATISSQVRSRSAFARSTGSSDRGTIGSTGRSGRPATCGSPASIALMNCVRRRVAARARGTTAPRPISRSVERGDHVRPAVPRSSAPSASGSAGATLVEVHLPASSGSGDRGLAAASFGSSAASVVVRRLRRARRCARGGR